MIERKIGILSLFALGTIIVILGIVVIVHTHKKQNYKKF